MQQYSKIKGPRASVHRSFEKMSWKVSWNFPMQSWNFSLCSGKTCPVGLRYFPWHFSRSCIFLVFSQFCSCFGTPIGATQNWVKDVLFHIFPGSFLDCPQGALACFPSLDFPPSAPTTHGLDHQPWSDMWQSTFHGHAMDMGGVQASLGCDPQ